MQVVSVENISNTERRLTIVLSTDQIEQAYSKQINHFAKNAKMKGFRPGKVPLSYIKERFGDEARREALENLIKTSLKDALKEKGLVPINVPTITPKPMETKDQPVEFVATFEVLPGIDQIQFSMDSVEKLAVEIKQEDLDYVKTQLLKQYTKWNEVHRPADWHDRVVINYHPLVEGNPAKEGSVKKYPLELGSKKMLPGFEEGLVGAKAGEERRLHLTFPADFPVAERAGTAVDFVVNIEQVFEAEKPLFDETFIHQLGIKSGKEDDFIQQIRQTLEQERNRLVKEKLKEQVFKLLLEQNPLEVPSSLIEREAKRIHDEIHPHQHHSHSMAEHSAHEVATFNNIAKKRVALSLLVSEYAKQNHLKPDNARIQARIIEIASAYEDPQEVVEWLSTDDHRYDIEAQVLEDQVVDKLLEGISTIEKTMSYAELKGIQQ